MFVREERGDEHGLWAGLNQAHDDPKDVCWRQEAAHARIHLPMSLRRHAIALLTLAAITALWLRPVLSRFSTAIPGAGAGDNVTFVWNLWWMRYVLHHPGYSFFSTPFLFYPFGADLTLHTHTALPAFVAAVAGPSSIVASQNLLIVLHIYLNFVCSYALGYRTTGRVSSALVAAVVFGASSFVGAHLMGHFNLIAAWIVPLVCLLAWGANERMSLIRAGLAGVAVAAAAYADYYLFVYTVVLLVLSWTLSIDRAIFQAGTRFAAPPAHADGHRCAPCARRPGDCRNSALARRSHGRRFVAHLGAQHQQPDYDRVILAWWVCTRCLPKGRCRFQIARLTANHSRIAPCRRRCDGSADATADSRDEALERGALRIAWVSVAQRSGRHRCRDVDSRQPVSRVVGRTCSRRLLRAAHRSHRSIRMDPDKRPHPCGCGGRGATERSPPSSSGP